MMHYRAGYHGMRHGARIRPDAYRYLPDRALMCGRPAVPERTLDPFMLGSPCPEVENGGPGSCGFPVRAVGATYLNGQSGPKAAL